MPVLTDLGMLLVLLGFGIAFVGVILSMISVQREQGRRVKTGGLVLVGPIPIVLSSDRKWTGVTAILALAFIFIILVMMGGIGL